MIQQHYLGLSQNLDGPQPHILKKAMNVHSSERANLKRLQRDTILVSHEPTNHPTSYIKSLTMDKTIPFLDPNLPTRFTECPNLTSRPQ
jgi:hypothetical protein